MMPDGSSWHTRTFENQLHPITLAHTGRDQGGYIFYAGASLAGAGYCRQTAILALQLWQGCQVCVKISAQRLPRVAQFNACWATSVVRTRVVGVANVGDSLRRLYCLQHRIYNLLGRRTARGLTSNGV